MKAHAAIDGAAAADPATRLRAPLAALALIALLAGAAIFLALRWGAGASPDSVVYLVGARSLAGGHGLALPEVDGRYAPVTHHAPLYPAALAPLVALGLDASQAARGLNAALFAAMLLLAGWLLLQWQDGAGSAWPALAAALALAAAPALVEAHLMAWTEPLFILLLLLAFATLAKRLQGGAAGWLIAAALLSALAALARYAGLALIAAGALGLLLFTTGSWKKRLAETAAYSLLAIAPFALWLLRNRVETGSAASRELFFHPITAAQLRLGLTTLAGWLLVPEDAPALMKLLPLAALVGMAALAAYWIGRRRGAAGLPMPARLLLVFIPLYLVFLVVSISFLDANTPLDRRILAPAFACGWILATMLTRAGLSLLPDGWMRRVIQIGLAALAALLIAGYAAQSARLLRSAYADGLGFNARAWRESALMAAVERLPAGTQIFSNGADAIELHTNRAASALPRKYEPANNRPNPEYDAELADLLARAFGGARVIYFTRLRQPNLPGADELQARLGVTVLYQADDGVILGSPGP